ncbi:MAG: hypothetical protein ACREQE_01635, partial [Candidatus Binataceae bacterium]
MSTWGQLDAQMARFSDRLTSQIKLTPEMAKTLASSIAADVRFLSLEEKLAIKSYSPVPIADRLSELEAFQGWMDFAHGIKNIKKNPYLTRAQVLTQNYICFVYLPEGCFRAALAKYCP